MKQVGNFPGMMPVKATISAPPALIERFRKMEAAIISEPPLVAHDPAPKRDVSETFPAGTDAIQFMIEPIPLATLTILRNAPAVKSLVTPDVASVIYLTLAKGESGYDVSAAARSSTARGAIQLLKGSYLPAAQVGSQLLKSLPVHIQSFISKLFSKLTPVGGGSWQVMKHDQPGIDASQHLASAGAVYQEISDAYSEWEYTSGAWRPRFKPTIRSRMLEAKHKLTLTRQWEGLQLLVTINHIQGLHWLTNKGPWDPAHEERLTSDPSLFSALFNNKTVTSTLTGVDLFVDFKRGDPWEQGDPQSQQPEMGFPFIFGPLLAFAKKVVPTITSKWGKKRKINPSQGIHHPRHLGLDLRAPEGTPVYAVDDGKVTTVKEYKGKGNWGLSIVLQCTDRDEFRYAHLSKAHVKEGELVKKGERLGLSGHSGVVQPHLHLEYYPQGGASSDPLKDSKHRWIYSLNV